MNIEFIEPEKLSFDLNNPRLIEYSTSSLSEDELVTLLWQVMDAGEIAQSIASAGYFSFDPLIVSKEGDKSVVIEGNRRLAAIRALLNPSVIGALQSEVPKITPSVRDSMNTIPIVYNERNESWKFIGFKHVNGAQKWGSFAKAKYIAQVHNEYNVSLEDIAKQIGDTNRTVQRLYRGLMILEQSERMNLFDREDAVKKPLPFSHLYVGIQREGFRNYLDLEESDTTAPVPERRKDNLRNVMQWLYGSKRDSVQPVVQSQNPDLGDLDTVLKNEESRIALESGQSLTDALELTKPPALHFMNNMVNAKILLTKAKGLITQGYDRTERPLKLSGTIADLAESIYSELEEIYENTKPKKDKRRRFSEET